MRRSRLVPALLLVGCSVSVDRGGNDAAPAEPLDAPLTVDTGGRDRASPDLAEVPRADAPRPEDARPDLPPVPAGAKVARRIALPGVGALGAAVWWARKGGLVLTEPAAKRLLLFTAPDILTPFATLTSAAIVATIDPRTDVLVVGSGSAVGGTDAIRRLDATGKTIGNPVAVHFDQTGDIVACNDGSFFVTDTVKGQLLHVVNPPANDKHQSDPKLPGASGLALSPDQRTLYAASKTTGIIKAYRVDCANAVFGRAVTGSPTTFANLRAMTDAAEPVGLTSDDAGNVYVAGGRTIPVLSPKGEVVQVISVGEVTSNLSFGGADRRTLYITAGAALFAAEPGLPGARQ